MTFDIIIRGGRIWSGDPTPPVAADLGIADGRIRAIGRIAGEAPTVIDAGGMTVATGFIDIQRPRAEPAGIRGAPRAARRQAGTIRMTAGPWPGRRIAPSMAAAGAA